MGGVVPPGDIFDVESGGAPFVDAEHKDKLYKARTPFGITAVKPKNTNSFGEDEVRFEIVIKGEDYTLTLPHNEVRERQAKAVLGLLAGGAEVVGPNWLTKVPTTGYPKGVWAITGTKPEDAPAPVAAAASTSSDDIPF